jgi:hypothetical protein
VRAVAFPCIKMQNRAVQWERVVSSTVFTRSRSVVRHPVLLDWNSGAAIVPRRTCTSSPTPFGGIEGLRLKHATT